MKDLLRRRLAAPLLTLLSQGITPRKIALSLATGLALSTFPLLGATSLLCTVAAIRLRLNLVAIQLVNWLAAPLQLALLVPFYRTGQWLLTLPDFPMTPAGLVDAFRADFAGTLSDMWLIVAGGTLVWLVTAVPAAILSHFLFESILRRWRDQPGASVRHA